MKPTLLLLLLLPLFSVAQSDSLLSYSGVVHADGVSKEQLFTRARSWLVNYFKDNRDVLQVQDKESGELIGKGSVVRSVPVKTLFVTTPMPATTSFRISVWVKEGKYKYEIGDINNTEFKQAPEPFGMIYTSRNTPPLKTRRPGPGVERMGAFYKKYRDDIDDMVKSIVTGLNAAMNVKAKSEF